MIVRKTSRWPGWRAGRAGLVRFGAVAMAGATMIAGCSSGESIKIGAVYPVEGKVLLPSGAPLAQGRVAFIPEDPMTMLPASGEIGSDGVFSLTTKSPRDGAVAGNYKIRIEPSEARRSSQPPKLPFAVKYTDEDASGIRVTIRPGANHLDPIKLSNGKDTRGVGRVFD